METSAPTTHRPASNPRFAQGAARYDSQASEDRPRRDLRQRCGRRGRRLHHQPRDFLSRGSRPIQGQVRRREALHPRRGDPAVRRRQAPRGSGRNARAPHRQLQGDGPVQGAADGRPGHNRQGRSVHRAQDSRAPQASRRHLFPAVPRHGPGDDRVRPAHRQDRLQRQRLPAIRPPPLPRRRHRHAVHLVHNLPHRSGRGVDRERRRRARTVPRHRARDSRGGPHHRATARVEQHGVLHRATRQKLPLGAGGLRGGQAATEHQRLVPRRGGA
mmetsp:Transcript_10117/g.39511  ORF Transcript_10117/g.39511 Transcript_10117/m.39511 type:complete len:272 (+) Transcript_10117:2-817(+)